MLKTLDSAYKIWHNNLRHIDKLSRFTLGAKIDRLFLETIEYIFLAGYAAREQKLPLVKQASIKLDLLKYFLQSGWEMNVLQHEMYVAIGPPLLETGKMIGGWQRQLLQEAGTGVNR